MYGVEFLGAAASGNVLEGNIIGSNDLAFPDEAALPNGLSGVATLENGASGNTIGGPTAQPGFLAGNVISGNTKYGVLLHGAVDNVVEGNAIGIETDGRGSMPNLDGIWIEASSTGNTIGGPATYDANAIGGNTAMGVYVTDSGTAGNAIQGNWIGFNAFGLPYAGNGAARIELKEAGANTVSSNVISGNLGSGILVDDRPAGPDDRGSNLIGTTLSGGGAHQWV